MANAGLDGRANVSSEDSFRALAVVSQAVVSHRDLAAVSHELAAPAHEVIRFDYLGLMLYEAQANTPPLHVLQPPAPTQPAAVVPIPVDETPNGLVWQTQQPPIVSSLREESPRVSWQELARTD
jgi:formate hydrogenlyase transcriptional activator